MVKSNKPGKSAVANGRRVLATLRNAEVINAKPSVDPARNDPTATIDSGSSGSEKSDFSDPNPFFNKLKLENEDETLKRSAALTRTDVVKRRLGKTRNLLKIYKRSFWILMQDVEARHVQYYKRTGKVGWRDATEVPTVREREGVPSSSHGDHKELIRERLSGEIMHCGAEGCTALTLPLSGFCFAHILLDPHQLLYRPCSHKTRAGQNGTSTCGKPILEGTVPSFCTEHFHQVSRKVTRSSKRVRSGKSKSPPKLPGEFHITISCYANEILSRRRELTCLEALQKEKGKTPQL